MVAMISSWMIFAFLCGSVASAGFKTVQIGPKPLWNETHQDKLKKHLLTNYDKYARPEHFDNATQVQMFLLVAHVDLEERRSILNVIAEIHLMWSDGKLRWDKSEFGGLFSLRLGEHEVWQPDISLYNSASEGEFLSRLGNCNVLVNSHGLVLWITRVKLDALCVFDLRTWPFDTQECTLRFGSWTYSDKEINLQLLQSPENESAIELDPLVVGSAWQVNVSSRINQRKYACCLETYTSALFHFVLTRKSAPYRAIVAGPAFAFTCLILAQFWLPPHAGEKIVLNGFAFVLLMMFILYFNHQIAGATAQLPLIVSYYRNCLCMITFSLILAIAGFTTSRIRKESPLPVFLKTMLKGRLGNLLFLEVKDERKTSIEEMKDHQLMEFRDQIPERKAPECAAQIEWIVFLIAVDRIAFVVYGFVFMVLGLSSLNVPASSHCTGYPAALNLEDSSNEETLEKR